MNTHQPTGGDDRPDSCGGSRTSKNNCQGGRGAGQPGDLELDVDNIDVPCALRPLSIGEGVRLRDDALAYKSPEGYTIPLEDIDESRHGPVEDLDGEIVARPVYRVLNEWREWYRSYQSAHIEFRDESTGDISYSSLENSYQPQYNRRYYARTKDLQRAIERSFTDLTVVMLTFSNSHLNGRTNLSPDTGDRWRCPADHMREIADGVDTARKQLYHVLDDRRWEYARVWEPHADGYGHLHMAVFVEGDATASEFEKVMRTHVDRVDGAAWDAHENRACQEHDQGGGWGDAAPGCDDCENPVSVGDDVENVAQYLMEYLDVASEEEGEWADPLEQPIEKQMFHATTWATGTRRLDFSNGAQELIAGEEFRRETGLRPEDRGAAESQETDTADAESDWVAESIAYVTPAGPDRTDPSQGGAYTTEMDGGDAFDPPQDFGPPPDE